MTKTEEISTTVKTLIEEVTEALHPAITPPRRDTTRPNDDQLGLHGIGSCASTALEPGRKR